MAPAKENTSTTPTSARKQYYARTYGTRWAAVSTPQSRQSETKLRSKAKVTTQTARQAENFAYRAKAGLVSPVSQARTLTSEEHDDQSDFAPLSLEDLTVQPLAQQSPSTLSKSSSPSKSQVSLTSEMRFGGLRKDPFSAFPIANNPKGWLAMDFYVQAYRPGLAPFILARQLGIPNECETFFPQIMKNPECFSSLVALCHHLRNLCLHAGAEKATETVIQHRGQAMLQLRSKLEQSQGYADDAAILTTLHLLGLDMQTKDWQAVVSHRHGLWQMVNSRGGMKGLGRLEYWVTLMELALSMVLNVDTPLFKCKKFDTVTYLPKSQQAQDLPKSTIRAPEGIVELLLRRKISLETFSILRRITDWQFAFTRVKSSRHNPAHTASFAADLKFVLEYQPPKDVMALASILSVLNAQCAQDPTTIDTTRLEICILHALILHSQISSAFDMAKSLPHFQTQRAELTRQVSLLDATSLLQSGTPRTRTAHLWLWVVTVSTWRRTYPRALPPEGLSLLTSLLTTCPALRDWAVVRTCLQNSFWHAPLVEEWRGCWDEGVRALAATTPRGGLGGGIGTGAGTIGTQPRETTGRSRQVSPGLPSVEAVDSAIAHAWPQTTG